MKKQNLWLVIASLMLISGLGPSALAGTGPSKPGGFTEKDKEFYLDAELLSFIRPGIEFELIDFVVEADNQPLATFSIKDPGGLPLDREGIFTPGPVDVRMMLTYIPQGEEYKVSYHDRSRDRNGTYTSLGDGEYTYKFTTVLPDDWDMNATHTLAVVTTRDLREFDLGRYYDNDVLNYVPSGEGEAMPRDIVKTATCNRCHDPLAMHGGRYQEVEVCQQCHNPGLFNDESNLSYSFNAVIHRVHSNIEPELDHDVHYPAILYDCEVCHTGGAPTADVPMVAGPNPIPVCDNSGRGDTLISWADKGQIDIYLDSPEGQLFTRRSQAGSQQTGKWVRDGKEFIMVDRATGDVIQKMPVNTTVLGCVGNAPGTFRGETGALHSNWMTRPSRLVCTSCHEHQDVNFEEGEEHPNLPDDSLCKFCHEPMGKEYGRSVTGAHTVDYKSAQLGGVLVDIKSVTNVGPGQSPTVTFSLGNKNGRLDPAVLGRLRFSLSGPNEDFEYYYQDRSALDKIVPSGNNWSYTFNTRLPSDAAGSYSVGVEGRISNAPVMDPAGEVRTVRDQAENYLVPFSTDGAEAVARRMIVDDYKCENCHANLALHGSNRHNAGEYCQTCHMPSATGPVADDDEPPAGEVGIHFKYMVHKIHRGADLENGYVVEGTDFGHVHFPGDLRNCESCHLEDTYELPLPEGALPTASPDALLSVMLPATASCLSCHDSDSAAVHADSNTSALGEACASCHGEDKTYSVEKVHAR